MLERNRAKSLNTIRELAEFFKQSDIEIFRPEGKLAIELMKSGHLTMKQAMSVSECSYRGFYLMVERLTSSEVIAIQQSNLDRRVKIIEIAEPIREHLLQIVSD